MSAIIDQVCRDYGITRAQLLQRDNRPEMAAPRRDVIARLFWAGRTNGEIGRLLERDPSTVGHHVREIESIAQEIRVMTKHAGPIKAGDRIVYSGGGAGIVEAVEVLGKWSVVRVRLPDESAEIVVRTPGGVVIAPVPLAATVRSGVRVHDLPVAVVEQVLAIAVLVMAGTIEGFEGPSKAPETSVERGSENGG